MQKFDLHMHTNFCDGNNSAEEMVLAAIDMGLETVGLSGHSYTWFDESYCMSKAGTLAYIDEVNRLKAKYAGRIRVLLGTEFDYHAEIDTVPYDYLIGSSHYILVDGVYCDVDASAKTFIDNAREHFGGDTVAAAVMYYAQVGDIVRKTGCDIIGHLDLVTKFNELYAIDAEGRVVERPAEDGSKRKIRDTYSIPDVGGQGGSRPDDLRPILDTEDPRYIAAWKQAIDRIFEDTAELRRTKPNALETLGILAVGDKPVFEINTGAMSKGYRTSPYPAPDQIEYIRSKGGLLILDSDSHFTDTICNAFDTLAVYAV